MAVFGYGRVSTVEQIADNQRLEIKGAGDAVECWYVDTVSGKAHAAQRRQFQRHADESEEEGHSRRVEAGPSWPRCPRRACDD